MKKIAVLSIVLITLLLISVSVSHIPPVPPQKWNAIPDGIKGDSTDVTTVLQALLDKAETRTGYVRLDSGTYLLTDSIVIPNGVTLEGVGANSKLNFPTKQFNRQ